jgi:hypothetical protein
MTRQLRDLPGAEVAEDLRAAHPQFVLQCVYFRIDVHRWAGACMAQRLNFGVQIGDGLFEIEIVRIHARMRTEGLKDRKSSRGIMQTPYWWVG